MDRVSISSLYDKKFKQNFGYDLKEKQIETISTMLQGNNCIGIFPTGFGKSMCFLLLPLILDELEKKHHICLIISPLKSLIIDQIIKARQFGIEAAGIMARDEMDDKTVKGIKEGKYSLVYLSPEMLLESEWNNVLLKSEIYQEEVCAVVIDEVHLLDTWGEKFRPTFSRLGEIRSHLTDIPFLLLTATCTSDILSSITKKLHIDRPDMIAITPDRKNIYLQYKSESGMNPMEELCWYLEKLRKSGKTTPKAILYARSVSLVGKLFCHMIGELQEAAYLNGEKCYENQLVAEFHAGLEPCDKKNILEKFIQPDSVIRFVISTVAFGLGVDVPDIRFILHWGVSESILQYWQEVGRAGRDGKKATAYMYATKPSIVHANSCIQGICRGIKSGSISCFRQAVLSSMIPVTKGSNPTLCISNCAICECSMCNCCNLCKSRCPCNKS